MSVQPQRHRDKSSAPRAALNFGKLATHLGYYLRRLQVEVFKDFIRTLATYDLRPAQYSVLILIAENPGRSQADIGAALGIERAGLAKMLNALQARGWVQRLDAINDGRSHSLFLTARGRKTLSQMERLGSAHEERVARLVGVKHRQQLMKLLKRFG